MLRSRRLVNNVVATLATVGRRRMAESAVVFTPTHEWYDPATGRVGITEFAQKSLGDITYVDLPSPNEFFHEGEVAGCIDSVKTASDITMPVSGTVVHTNPALADLDSLSIINSSPEKDGWLFCVDASASTSS